MTNNQKEKVFSNKFIQNFLENQSKVTLENKYKFAEIASSLAYLSSKSNYKTLIAAADTFRAAAVEQLKVWGDRSNVDVISNQ